MYWNGGTTITFPSYTRLIETWDVLKLYRANNVRNAQRRLIETWDVLKCGTSLGGENKGID